MKQKETGSREAALTQTDADLTAGGPRKQKKTQKVNSDRKFICTHDGCSKSYTRAEHLHRHQQNHTPQTVYNCGVSGCDKTFVRKDLCKRHEHRHILKDSQIQKRYPLAVIDHCLPEVDRHQQPPVMTTTVDFTSARPAATLPDGGVATLTPQSVNSSSKQIAVSSSNPQSNHGIDYLPGQSTALFSLSELQKPPYLPLTGCHPTGLLGSPSDQAFQRTGSDPISWARPQNSNPAADTDRAANADQDLRFQLIFFYDGDEFPCGSMCFSITDMAVNALKKLSNRVTRFSPAIEWDSCFQFLRQNQVIVAHLPRPAGRRN